MHSNVIIAIHPCDCVCARVCVEAISLSQATMAVFLKCLQLIEMQNLCKLEEKYHLK